MKHRSRISIFILFLAVLFFSLKSTQFIFSYQTEDNFLFLPIISKPPSDLSISNVEITQAIQTATNSVPLVENRQTVIRIYAKTSDSTNTTDVNLSLAASRNGTPLPESPIVINSNDIPPLPSRGDYNSSINVHLPTSWLSGDVHLTVTIDPDNLIHERDEGNNSFETIAHFNYVPPLNIVMVPINYTHTASGTYYPSYPADDNEMIRYLMKLFPLHDVSVSYRSPINFEGDLAETTEWWRLVNTLSSIKGADGTPKAQVYYGLIPEKDSNGNFIDLAWGGMSGMFSRVSVGIANQFVFTHEIGHNFGRLHAPCGNPDYPDPDYPYSNGSIGEYGLDISENRIVLPETHDFMSYCGPEWISDYTYQGLYNDQLAHGFMTQTPFIEGMLIRIVFDKNDIPSFLPTYELSTRQTKLPFESEYTIDLLTANGDILNTYPVTVDKAGEGESLFSSINVVVPNSQSVTQVRLLKNGQVMAENTLNQYQETATVNSLEQILTTLDLSESRSNAPVLVRYTPDNGQSWTTIGVDVIDSEFHYDVNSLPNNGHGDFEIVFGR